MIRRILRLSRADEILAKLTQGASPRSLQARLVPGHMLYPIPTVKTIVRHGVRFELDVSDYMEWCAYYGLETEPRSILYSLAGPGQVILDVGTNVGETLLNFARLAGPGGKVYGFEINPKTHAKCLRNIAINPFKNIKLFGVGLGHVEGEARIFSPSPRNSGGDRISSSSNAAGSQLVRITTIDRFVKEEAIERVDLIKIDVEGFDLNVLKGAEATLRSFKPILFVELGHANLVEQGSTARELLLFLESFSYRIRHAVTGVRVSSSDSLEDAHFDIICE